MCSNDTGSVSLYCLVESSLSSDFSVITMARRCVLPYTPHAVSGPNRQLLGPCPTLWLSLYTIVLKITREP